MDTYLGAILIFGGTFTIRGYALCQGQLLSITQNTALFAILGITYGGNGTTDFALPDLQGRSPVGTGNGAGLGSVVPGQKAGAETVTLITSNLPAHTHAFTGALNAVQTKGTTEAPATGSQLARTTDVNNVAQVDIYVPAGTSGAQVALGGLTGTNGLTGSGQPVAIRSPYLGLTHQIALQGIFPTRA